ncbi:HpcH/HpaI aldolase/citrate lyase family protein [Streptomyces sp. NPDC004752]
MSSEAREPLPVRPPLRSLLFVPGTRTDWLPKAQAAGADAVIFDLEDAVPEADKPLARAHVSDTLALAAEDPGQRTALFVRINPLDGWAQAAELRTLARPGLTGLILPKVRCAQDIRIADRLLSWCEHEQDLPEGSIALVPLLETARGLREAYHIARAARRIAYLGALATSGGDIEGAVGYRWSPEGTETLTLRSRVLLDARAADVPNPVTGLWTRITDLAGLREFAVQNRALGYEGMMAVHPSHVPVINEVFSPTPEELTRYERLIATVEAAQATGSGAVLFEGEMVDEAMAATARRALLLHPRNRPDADRKQGERR